MSTGVTNFFFNNFSDTDNQERLLLEDMIVESIAIYGMDVYYVTRKINNYDQLYGADDQSTYNLAVPIAMYLESYDGFQGDGNFMSKFGLEIRDQVVFSVAQRIFTQEVGSITNQIRPNEGDLLYYPLNQKVFQIKFVDKFQMNLQLGGLFTWKMTAELFEYSNEIFNTGIPEIDIIQSKFSTDSLNWGIMDEYNNYISNEDNDYIIQEASDLSIVTPGADNEIITQKESEFVDFSTTDPFSEGF